MKSSSGEYYIGLDHVRALAAFLVFTWHFNHINGGQLDPPVNFFLSILTEGHIGVAVFMTLSGYLFAKILNGRQIRYLPFLWNRGLRLLPLLLAVFVIVGIRLALLDKPLDQYLFRLIRGFFLPTWPNGGWSVAVEIHFYLILPLLMLISARNRSLIMVIVVAAMAGRFIYWHVTGSVQIAAYWTIVGGIDQFIFGIFAYNFRNWVIGRHVLAFLILCSMLSYVYAFDRLGGFYMNGDYPTNNMIWVYHSSILGASFAFLIAWYDGSFRFRDVGFSGALAKIGACSYSIYLLHTFVVFRIGNAVNVYIFELNNLYLVIVFSTLSFLCFVPVAYLSFKIIESPPMRFRLQYLK